MSRNFGIQNVRADLGGGKHPPARYAPITQRGSNVIRLDLPDLRGGETVSSFLPPDDREFAAKCFFAGVLTVVGIFLFAVWFALSQFIA